MTPAAGYLIRIELRRRWLSLLVLGILVALVVGTVVAALAGADRSATAFDRYLDDYRSPARRRLHRRRGCRRPAGPHGPGAPRCRRGGGGLRAGGGLPQRAHGRVLPARLVRRWRAPLRADARRRSSRVASRSATPPWRSRSASGRPPGWGSAWATPSRWTASPRRPPKRSTKRDPGARRPVDGPRGRRHRARPRRHRGQGRRHHPDLPHPGVPRGLRPGRGRDHQRGHDGLPRRRALDGRGRRRRGRAGHRARLEPLQRGVVPAVRPHHAHHRHRAAALRAGGRAGGARRHRPGRHPPAGRGGRRRPQHRRPGHHAGRAVGPPRRTEPAGRDRGDGGRRGARGGGVAPLPHRAGPTGRARPGVPRRPADPAPRGRGGGCPARRAGGGRRPLARAAVERRAERGEGEPVGPLRGRARVPARRRSPVSAWPRGPRVARAASPWAAPCSA